MPLHGLAPGELIIDSFAGGGGASTGLEWALGRSPDVAINHDPEAIAMHAANHPRVPGLDRPLGRGCGVARGTPALRGMTDRRIEIPAALLPTLALLHPKAREAILRRLAAPPEPSAEERITIAVAKMRQRVRRTLSIRGRARLLACYESALRETEGA